VEKAKGYPELKSVAASPLVFGFYVWILNVWCLVRSWLVIASKIEIEIGLLCVGMRLRCDEYV
jgi:hypothetical protein